jgi:hypothetical protein
MRKKKEESLFRSLGRTIRRINLIRERRDSKILSIETSLGEINKISLLRMNSRRNTHWEKR